MKQLIKTRVGMLWTAALAAVALIAVALFIGTAAPKTVYADDANVGATYYRAELKKSELAQKFYGVLESMYKDGSFKSGVAEYDLVANGVLKESQVSAYLEGDVKVPVALGAARDAFFMDNPDLFYIDVYKLYLSAGLQNGKNVAFIGTGRADNYYTDSSFKTAADVDKAIDAYDKAIAAVVAEANKASDVVGKIKAVNKYICANTEYAYGDRGAFVSTAYGALVEKYALCGGYARAFKAVMDELNIPCVLIQGTVYSGKSVDGLAAGMEAHMWNAVEVNGHWYGVDVTYNSSCGNIEKYMLVGEDFLSINHFEDGVISSSGFELKYPALRPLNYGIKEDASGFLFEDEAKVGKTQFGYVPYVDPDDGIEKASLVLGVSYEGKDGMTLMNEGKYLAYRATSEKDQWTNWFCMPKFYKDNMEDGSGFVGKFTIFDLNFSINQAQFAIIDYAPDGPLYTYDPEKLSDAHITAVSTVFTNKGYGCFIPAPYVKKITPNGTGMIMSFDPVKVTLEYSEKLVKVDDGKPVGLSITGKSSDLREHCKVEDLVWDAANNKLTFTFTPSRYYAHNCEVYNFVPTNLVGQKSEKVPESGQLTFKMKQVVCPKVFNDGRLYMQVFGEPQFVGAEDMSLDGFKDKDGKPVSGQQRSQLMLVVNEPGESESAAMKDKLLADTDLEAGDIKQSSTYQIDLHLCGIVQNIPKGSYMQVGFGFPEGFKYTTPGVTFTVYHYTLKPDGTIDEVEPVPCVVTEYGIVATVKSFSPFMICAIDSDKAPTDKYVYSGVVNGEGGSIDKTTVSTVKSGESVSYTLTADSGYVLDKIKLNGTDITDKAVGTGAQRTLTLAYADLGGKGNAAANSNVIEVSYVAERVAASNEDKGFEIVEPKNLIVTADDLIQAVSHNSKSGKKSNVGAIVGGILAALIVLAAGTFLVIFFLNKKKKAEASANVGNTSRTRTSSTASKSSNRTNSSRTGTTNKNNNNKRK